MVSTAATTGSARRDRANERGGTIGVIELVYVGSDPTEPVATMTDAVDEAVSITAVADAATLLDRLDGGSIDCVVSENDLPDSTGVALLGAVRRRRPELPFVLIGDDVDERVATEAIASGVTACVRRTPDPAAARSGSSVETGAGEPSDAERSRRDAPVAFAEALVEASTSEAVCEAAVGAIERWIGLPIGATYLYDGERGELRPCRWTAGADGELSEEPLAAADADPTWRTFVEDEHCLVRTPLPRPADPTDDPALARGVVLPLEGHGVLLAGTKASWPTTKADLDAVRTVALATRHALERVAATDRLSECRRTVVDHEETVDRLRAIGSLDEAVGRAIVASTTREVLEQSVCDRLLDHDPYVFVWIGVRDVVDGTIEPRAWAGAEKSYLTTLRTERNDSTGSVEPMAEAIRRGEPHIEQRIVGEPPLEEWRKEALRRGYRSVCSLPIRYHGARYGGISVYSDRVSAFDRIERSVLDALGDRLGHAINALEVKRALVEEGVVELEFRVRDTALEFFRWTEGTDRRFEMERVIARPDGSIRSFFVVEGLSAEEISALVDGSPAIDDAQLVAERNGRCLFSGTLTDESLSARLLEYGAVTTAMSADGESARVVLELPSGSNVREFVEVFEALYADSSLVSRRDRERSARTRDGFEAELEERLTDRQLETLRTAYVSGFFETPRDSTGEEVAELLGITQPTFNHHLRAALRKLLSMLIEEGP